MNVILNNLEHRELKVLDAAVPGYEANTNFAQLMPAELRVSQNIFPIFFQKDLRTGKFFISALLGFIEGENLFVNKGRWDSPYIPMTIVRQPFMIAKQKTNQGGMEKESFVISVDLENPKVNKPEGKRLFDDNGQPTDFLNNISAVLDEIHHGLVESDQFIDRLLAHNLIENATLDVTLDEMRHYEFTNLYTINEAVLADLPSTVIVELIQSGDMEKIYSIALSQGHIGKLIELKKQQDL